MKNEHIASSVTELIGKTPLLRASRFAAAAGISNAPLLKLEYFKPRWQRKRPCGTEND